MLYNLISTSRRKKYISFSWMWSNQFILAAHVLVLRGLRPQIGSCIAHVPGSCMLVWWTLYCFGMWERRHRQGHSTSQCLSAHICLGQKETRQVRKIVLPTVHGKPPFSLWSTLLPLYPNPITHWRKKRAIVFLNCKQQLSKESERAKLRPSLYI